MKLSLLQGLKRRVANDRGSTLPLTIGLAALALAAILVAVDASSLYLERRRLLGVADGAALVAAESFALDDVVLGAGGAAPTLDDAALTTRVMEWVESVPLGHDLVVEQASSADQRGATVTLVMRWHAPISGVFVPDGIDITASSTARSRFID